MALIYNGVEEKIMAQALTEIDRGRSHRAVAIVGAAFVENSLTNFLHSRMQHDHGGKIFADMTNPNGPIGAFGAKASVGFLMGLYSEAAMKELKIIQRIRNDFAHKMHAHKFDNESIAERCSNLNIWKEVKIKLKNVTPEGDRPTLQISIGRGYDKNESPFPIIDIIDSKRKMTPRKQFSSACKFYIAAMSICVNMNHKNADILF